MTKPYGFVNNLRFLRYAFASPNLTYANLAILGQLVAYADQAGNVVYFSAAKVAKERGISRQAVQHHVKKLIREKFILKIERLGQTNHYQINFSLYDNTASVLTCPLHYEPASESDCVGDKIKLAPPASEPDCPMKHYENSLKIKGQANTKTWREEIKRELGEAVYRSWIERLNWDGHNTIIAPTKFMADWINTHYLECLKRHTSNNIIIQVKPTAKCT